MKREKRSHFFVPECEYKYTDWWLNSISTVFLTSYTCHARLWCLQKSFCFQGQRWKWEYLLSDAVWETPQKHWEYSEYMNAVNTDSNVIMPVKFD